MIKNYFILKYVKRYKLQISIGIVFILVLPLLTLPIPMYMMDVIDNYIRNKDVDSIEKYGLLIFTLYTGSVVLSYFQTNIFYIYNCKIVKDIRLDLFSKVFNSELTSLGKMEAGDICARIEDDIKNLSVLFIDNIANLIKDSLTFIVCFIMMFRISIEFSSIFLAILCLYAGITIFFKSRVEKLSKRYIQALSDCKVSLIEFVSNLSFIKVNRFTAYTIEKYDEKSTQKQNRNIDLGVSRNIGESIIDYLIGIFPILTLLIGAYLVINDSFTVGSIIAYNSYFAYCINPLKNITNFNLDLSQAKFSLIRMNEIIRLNSVNGVSSRSFSGLTLQNISYQIDGISILNRINLEIRKDEKLAIIGKSGSGKSTLRKIITGEITPQSGKITSNEDSIPYSFSGMFTQSDSYIFDGDLKSNITLNNEYDEDFYKSILKTCLINDIDKFNDSISNLSHGERQKVALARALYQAPDFLVIDESLSNIDLADLYSIVDNLISISNLTVILITHNLSLSNKFDSIMLLKHGEGRFLSEVADTKVLA